MISYKEIARGIPATGSFLVCGFCQHEKNVTPIVAKFKSVLFGHLPAPEKDELRTMDGPTELGGILLSHFV